MRRGPAIWSEASRASATTGHVVRRYRPALRTRPASTQETARLYRRGVGWSLKAEMTARLVAEGRAGPPDGRQNPRSGEGDAEAVRIHAFAERAALVWARLMAEGRAAGRPRSALDTLIAATAEVNGCVVVTANEREFLGVEVVNPMRVG